MNRPNPLDATQAMADRLDECLCTLRREPHPMIVALSRCDESGPGWLTANVAFTVAGISAILPNVTAEEMMSLGQLFVLYARRMQGDPN